MVILREVVPVFKDYITLNHMENMNKIIMSTGMIVGYAYGSEFFIAWYSVLHMEGFAFLNRAFGPYWWSYWIMISCNVLFLNCFGSNDLEEYSVMFVVSIFVNIGMGLSDLLLR